MPLIDGSSYPGPPKFLFNGHLETIFPDLFSKPGKVTYERTRFTLSDGDFLDLDWMRQDADRLVILSHGLVGSSDRPYILRAAKFYYEKGWDVLAWNCRSCGGEINNAFRLYHHGEIEDFTELLNWLDREKSYKSMALIGYSMGGSIVMKYAGVTSDAISPKIKAVVSFCAPFEIEPCAQNMDHRKNAIYSYVFRRDIKEKLYLKDKQFPGRLDLDRINKAKSWREFDEHFSARINGFSSADEFYYHASVKHFLSGLSVPTLSVNPINDPIIPYEVVPLAFAKQNKNLHAELPKRGGHVGFSLPKADFSWMEYRSVEFIEQFL